MYLLDTNVVSELRKAKPHGGVLAWIKQHDSRRFWLSAMTVGELQKGIELTRDQDPARAEALEHWLERTLLCTSQILALDSAVCRAWAKLLHRQSGTLSEDAFIGATAQVHGLTVVTRNVRDFQSLGLAVINPFEFR